jgi:motility quorum-sensing regulator/GCU-specific mRNA interferase toxin
MEKRKPHCPLPVIRSMTKEGKVRATISAVASAYALGFDFDEMVSVVMALTSKDFYKSMTTLADHKVWQDVYRPVTKAGEIYLKLMVVDDVLIVSFKEL